MDEFHISGHLRGRHFMEQKMLQYSYSTVDPCLVEYFGPENMLSFS